VLFPAAGFGAKSDVWSAMGYSNIKNIARSLKKHAESKEHIQADVRLQLMGKQRINEAIDEGVRVQNQLHNATVAKNRLVLERLIDITCLLACQERAFRGHDESHDSANKGDYREQYEHLCKYDEVLRNAKDSKIFSGVSKITQNELIECVAHCLQEQIATEISQSEFFSWEIDETTDISCKSQVSVIFRYVVRGEVVERFMGFHDVSAGRNATCLNELVTKEFAKFDYKNKLVSQTYDGAAVMASELNGLQAKIKAVAPQATFVHCYAHLLNLVLSKGANNIKDVRIFFGTLAGMAAFFSKSTKRMHVLESKGVNGRIPTSAPTRWIYSSRAVNFVANMREQLIATFEEICNSVDFEDVATCESAGFARTLEDFRFTFLLFAFRKVFAFTDVLYDILQSKSTDIEFCRRRISATVESITNLRSDREFDIVYTEVCDLIAEPAIPRGVRNNIQGKSPRDNARITYFEILDNLLQQAEARFGDFEKLAFLRLVDVTKFDSYSIEFPASAYKKLLDVYGKYFDEVALKNELIVLYRDKNLWEKSKSASEILIFFTKEGLELSMPQLTRFLTLVLTIPATSASSERSFSCLKRIKTCTRSTTSQKRMSALGLVSIEKKLLKYMEKQPAWYPRIINHFASMKDRRLDLNFR
jgi:Domain of unknown function (DUF4371)/hAT family C-terminal dimerisation region